MAKRIIKESAFFSGRFEKEPFDPTNKKPKIRSAGTEMARLMRTFYIGKFASITEALRRADFHNFLSI